jgi:biopolymer transport protein ExbD
MSEQELPVSFGGKRNREETEMDMTPMVDVTFLLLIFFMVTAAFTMQKSFRVPTPRPDQPSTSTKTVEDFEEDKDFVVIRIDEFNTFNVSAASWDEEEEAPSPQDLLIKLRKAREADSATKLLVMAHGDASHEKVVTAMDAGNEVGMEEVKLVTVEDEF